MNQRWFHRGLRVSTLIPPNLLPANFFIAVSSSHIRRLVGWFNAIIRESRDDGCSLRR
jgi:hypothetical protein